MEGLPQPRSSMEEHLGTMVRKKVPPTPAWGTVWREQGSHHLDFCVFREKLACQGHQESPASL